MNPQDNVSEETAALAAKIRREAAELPDPGEIRDLAERAIRHGAPGKSREELRALADEAIQRAGQVTELLRELSALLGDPVAAPQPGGSQ